jgi:hypothetical protein
LPVPASARAKSTSRLNLQHSVTVHIVSSPVKMVSFLSVFVAGLMATTAFAAPAAHRHGHVTVPAQLHEKRDSSKRGAAYNDASLVSLITGASWAYNWNDVAGGTLPTGVEFVPMLWGTKMFDGWQSAVETALSSGSSHILGFNEPDNSGQAAMSPSDAVNYYKQYITPYAGQAQLGTPAVTNGNGAGIGLDWLSQFLDLCAGTCGQSFIALHWYNDASQFEDLQNHINQALAIGAQHGINKVWLTEFAPQGDTDSQVSFLQQALPWLDSQEGVERYAYFMASNGVLVNGGSLSQLGQAYVETSS